MPVFDLFRGILLFCSTFTVGTDFHLHVIVLSVYFLIIFIGLICNFYSNL